MKQYLRYCLVTHVSEISEIYLQRLFAASFFPPNGNSLRTRQFRVFLPDTSAFLNRNLSGKGRLVFRFFLVQLILSLASLGVFSGAPVQLQLENLESEQNQVRTKVKEQTFILSCQFGNFEQKKDPCGWMKIISTKCCWRHPSSNIFMVHWRSGEKRNMFGKWQNFASISSGCQVRETRRNSNKKDEKIKQMPSKKIRYVSEKKNISCQWAKTDKINQENGKTLPQSYPDIRSERQNR